jgi:hypothetical protein
MGATNAKGACRDDESQEAGRPSSKDEPATIKFEATTMIAVAVMPTNMLMSTRAGLMVLSGLDREP